MKEYIQYTNVLMLIQVLLITVKVTNVKISSNLHLLTLFTLSQLLLTVLPYWRKENHDAWNAQPNVWNFPADFQGTLCYIESEPNLKLSLKFPVNDVCMLDYFLLPLDNYKHFWAFYM